MKVSLNDGESVIEVEIAMIAIDHSLKARVAQSDEAVEDYADNLDRLPPVNLFKIDRELVLADGHHRLAAHKKRGKTHIRATIRVGTKQEATLFAAGANVTHGLRRTNADKRRAVEMTLGQDGWLGKSDELIARHCGVSRPFVTTVRSSLETVASGEHAAVREGVDGRAINVSRIGKPKPQPATPHEEGGELTGPPVLDARMRLPIASNAPEPAMTQPLPKDSRVILTHLHEITSAYAVIENRSEDWSKSLSATSEDPGGINASMHADLINTGLAIAQAQVTLLKHQNLFDRALSAVNSHQANCAPACDLPSP